MVLGCLVSGLVLGLGLGSEFGLRSELGCFFRVAFLKSERHLITKTRLDEDPNP
jgi:hypothetical protein